MNFETLGNIFSNRLFRIPDYQRGYAWRSDVEIVDFWNDLMNLPAQKSHFTGSLTLQEITLTSTDSLGFDRWLCDEKSYKAWFVIDGQQRLTTSVILLQGICDFLATIDPNEYFLSSTVKETIDEIRRKYICVENKRQCAVTYIFGYNNNSVSDQFLRRNVFNDPNVTCSEESYYTLNIKKAKEFFMQNIVELYKVGGIEAIEILYKKLTQQLKFQLIEVKQTDDFNIFVAFETINNRGRQLSNLEKLKNRLIYLTTLYHDASRVPLQTAITPIRKHINDGWAEIYRQMGRNVNLSSTGKVAVLDDDEFLKTHWILYFQYSRKTGNDYIKFLLGKHFTTQNVLPNQAEADSVLEYMSDENSDNYDANEEFEPKTSSVKAQLTMADIHDYVTDLMNTSKAWYYTWFPQDAKAKGELGDEEIKWMQRINRLGIAYFRPLITALFYKRIIDKTISAKEVVGLLESIERFIFINFRLQTTRSHYGSSEFSIAAKDLHKGTKEVKTIIDMLEERINRSFESGTSIIRTKNVQVMVEKLFEQKDDERAGFYRWSAIHYFLYEYNEWLGEEYHGVNCSWEDFKLTEKDKISIEHIFPHNVTPYWQEKFKNISPDQWAIYQGSLGNLLLLSQKINASLQDDDFETKKNGIPNKRNGYSKGSYSELEVSENADWTPTKIEERGMKMLRFMQERWKFEFKSEDDMKDLLLPCK